MKLARNAFLCIVDDLDNNIQKEFLYFKRETTVEYESGGLAKEARDLVFGMVSWRNQTTWAIRFSNNYW